MHTVSLCAMNTKANLLCKIEYIIVKRCSNNSRQIRHISFWLYSMFGIIVRTYAYYQRHKKVYLCTGSDLCPQAGPEVGGKCHALGSARPIG